MDWVNLIKFVSGITVFSASIITVAIYIGKKLINKSLDLAIEKYKANLNKEVETHKSGLQKDIESFRYDLQKSAIERQILFNKLQEERGSAIKTIDNNLYSLEKSLSNLTTTFQGPEWLEDVEKDKIAMKDLENYYEFYEHNRIYFENDLYLTFKEIFDKCFSIINEMRSIKRQEKSNIRQLEYSNYVAPVSLTEPLERWLSLEKNVKTEIAEVRNNLVNEFRKLIGVE